jgi:hypothetical protein
MFVFANQSGTAVIKPVKTGFVINTVTNNLLNGLLFLVNEA